MWFHSGTHVQICERILRAFENFAEIARGAVPHVNLVSCFVSRSGDHVFAIIAEAHSIPGSAIDKILEAMLRDEQAAEAPALGVVNPCIEFRFVDSVYTDHAIIRSNHELEAGSIEFQVLDAGTCRQLFGMY